MPPFRYIRLAFVLEVLKFMISSMVPAVAIIHNERVLRVITMLGGLSTARLSRPSVGVDDHYY